MDINVIQPKILEAPKTEEQINIEAQNAVTGDKVSVNDPLALIELQQYFEIKNPNNTEHDNFKTLISLFEDMGYENIGDVLTEIQIIELQIGSGPFGMSRMQHLINYLKIDRQISRLENIKKLYGVSTKH